MFPDSLPAIVNGKDTMMEMPQHVPAKILIFYDSTSCTCRISYFVDYNMYVDYSDFVGIDSFYPVVIYSVYRNDGRDVINMLKLSRYGGPIFIDSTGVMGRLNKIPPNGNVHVMLLDKKNNILKKGDPTYNQSLWTSYKEKIDSMVEKSP